MTPSPAAPDVRKLSEQSPAQGAAGKKFPGGGPEDFRIFFTPEVHAELARHAGENTAVEMAAIPDEKRSARSAFIIRASRSSAS